MTTPSSLHLIWFSPTRTSRTTAWAVARGTSIAEIRETDLTYGKPDRPIRVPADALTILAVPVYAGRIPPVALTRLEPLCGSGGPVVTLVIYGNRDYEDALLELTDWATDKNFVPIAGAAFIGEHSYSKPGRPVAAGRPDTEDLRQAENFGRQIIERLSSPAFPDKPVLEVRGNRPYKARKPQTPQAPDTDNDLCTQCGYCIEICPTQAISLQDEIVSDPSSCIKCCACVKFCPCGARLFETPFTDYLYQNFSARKTPELFFGQ